jgi:arginine N-succinyltransferase
MTMNTNAMTVQETTLDNGTRSLVALSHQGVQLASATLLTGIGLAQPRFWFHVGLVVHAAATLGLLRPQRTLLLGNDLTGAAELCDITWHDASALAPLLAAAQAAVRSAPQPAGRRLIVELPGLQDGDGAPLFWRGLGRHFYGGDLATTAARAGPAVRSHVAALLPRHVIYASFLPEAAQAAIGGCASSAAALRDALTAAGWQWQQHIGIVDGGAVMEWAA